MKRNTRNITYKIVAGVAVVITALALRGVAAELRRYMRIRRM